MLQTKRVRMAAPLGDSCARSRSFSTSDASTFEDFEKELLEAIAAVDNAGASACSKETDE